MRRATVAGLEGSAISSLATTKARLDPDLKAFASKETGQCTFIPGLKGFASEEIGQSTHTLGLKGSASEEIGQSTHTLGLKGFANELVSLHSSTSQRLCQWRNSSVNLHAYTCYYLVAIHLVYFYITHLFEHLRSKRVASEEMGWSTLNADLRPLFVKILTRQIRRSLLMLRRERVILHLIQALARYRLVYILCKAHAVAYGVID